MKYLLFFSLLTSSLFADPAAQFISTAKKTHGAFGEKAARFLVEHMPDADRDTVDAAFLTENLDLALKARARFPWAQAVPEELFLNEVLPYAVFDETRERWRAGYFEKAAAIVKEATTASEAAQLLNRDFFNAVNVHYNTGRKQPNQSPAESAELGIASCTGLSIILVDACRAVGIPARAVGTPMWSNDRGNHTWVEIWDEGWQFIPADEYDAKGLNRAWFSGDAAKAREDEPQYAIYASSWKKTDLSFPMIWNSTNRSVPAENVTARYVTQVAEEKHELGIRLTKKGKRISMAGALITPEGEVLTRFKTQGEEADRNDVPRVEVVPGTSYRLRFKFWQTEVFTATAGESIMDVFGKNLKRIPKELSAEDMPALTKIVYEALLKESKDERAKELEELSISLDDKTMRWKEKSFGNSSKGKRSLWISMHGGGGAPAAVNDRQWNNQIGLYKPKEGIYIAPRAPTDTWNLWHQGHIDPMFARLIENQVALRDVDPNKVYILGYSAGGDGVWQLAPRMADRYAAASMMAGHPNEAKLLGLYNLPFAIFMGGADAAYDRNKVAAERAEALATLQKENPNGYVHLVRIYEGLPHWMDGKDKEALPWMAKFERNPWPKNIVWYQDDITHERFYWLKLPAGSAVAGKLIEAHVEGQHIHLIGDVPDGLRIRLSDELINLDQPIQVEFNGTQVFSGKVKRSKAVLKATLQERLDPPAAASAEIVVKLP